LHLVSRQETVAVARRRALEEAIEQWRKLGERALQLTCPRSSVPPKGDLPGIIEIVRLVRVPRVGVVGQRKQIACLETKVIGPRDLGRRQQGRPVGLARAIGSRSIAEPARPQAVRVDMEEIRAVAPKLAVLDPEQAGAPTTVRRGREVVLVEPAERAVERELPTQAVAVRGVRGGGRCMKADDDRRGNGRLT